MVLILASCLLKFQGSNPTFAGCADPEDCNLGRIGAQRLISGPRICVPTRDPCSLRHLSLLAAIVLVGTSQVWFSVLFWGFFFFFCTSGDFPYFLVNSVVHLKEYLLSFTQNFQMFL